MKIGEERKEKEESLSRDTSIAREPSKLCAALLDRELA